MAAPIIPPSALGGLPSQGHLHLPGGQLAYETWGGEGARAAGRVPRLLVALHGFNGHTGRWRNLPRRVQDECQVLAFDLPGHGRTIWGKKSMGAADIKALLAFIEQCHDAMQTAESKPQLQPKISMLAYSLGGRIALALMHSKPQLWRQILLLAPDGLQNHLVFAVATRTAIGRSLLRRTMANPAGFIKLANKAHTRGLLPKGAVQGMMYYIGDATMRQCVVESWSGLGSLRIPVAATLRAVDGAGGKVRVVLGRRDPLINPKVARALDGTPAELVWQDTGHWLIDAATLERHAGFLVE